MALAHVHHHKLIRRLQILFEREGFENLFFKMAINSYLAYSRMDTIKVRT